MAFLPLKGKVAFDSFYLGNEILAHKVHPFHVDLVTPVEDGFFAVQNGSLMDITENSKIENDVIYSYYLQRGFGGTLH